MATTALPAPLRAPELLKTRAFVDGAWIDADSGETFPVVDPATGATIADVPRLGAASVAARTIQRDQLPEDVVGAAVYLAGPSASFVTGQTIVIDGSQTFH